MKRLMLSFVGFFIFFISIIVQCVAQPIVWHQGISQTNIDVRGAPVTVGQLTINAPSSGTAVVRFDGSCYASVGDLIVLAASNTADWGVNDGNVSVESVNSDVNHHPFSHTRVYHVSAGNHTFYAVAENYVEQAGTGRTSIYASLTVEFFPDISMEAFAEHQGISQTNIDVRGAPVTVGQLTINAPSSGTAVVRFDGSCYASVGDLIVLAASNTANWGVNDGNVSVESVNSDVNHHPFSHTRVYQVAAGNHTFYAVAENYVEQAGTGRTSIYASLTIEFFPAIIYDLIGTWDGQGVYYRKSSDGTWVKMASPADLIAAGDLDGDGTDDLIGIWAGQGGVWVKYSSTGSWSKLSTTANAIASGDMNGDGRDDLLGTWDGQGVYYRDSDTGTWVKMASPADLISAGDLDGDGMDDLIGIWAGQGGVWVKYSSTASWSKLSTTARDIASGDMNGDGTDDLLGTWDGQGVYYRDSDTGAWVKMASPADLIATGDLDGDGTDDLIGIWAGQGGVWVKYSSTVSWSKLSTTARDIDAGKMSGGAWGGGLTGFIKLLAPIGGYAEGPESLVEYEDLSSKGPGGWNFVYQEEKNLFPQEKEPMRIMKIHGPGEPGFRCIEQKNLFPQERIEKKKKIRRK